MTRQLFISVSILFLAFVSTPAFAGAADDAALMPFRQFVDGVNKNDIKTAAAAFVPSAGIIDEFAPHHWQGADAFAQWDAALNADMKAHGMTEPFMALGKPLHLDVTGDTAYAVVPGHYTYKQGGKAMHEDGTFAVALAKTASGWRIAAWSWATK